MTEFSNHSPHTFDICKTFYVRCKFCGSSLVVKYGMRDNMQQYMCRSCNRKFTEKDTLDGKQTPTEEIGASLSMFYDGLSLSAISRQLEGIFADSVDPSTIYRWILEYSKRAIDLLDKQTAKVSRTWIVDETVVQIGGYNLWYWDCIDEDTRFLIRYSPLKIKVYQ